MFCLCLFHMREACFAGPRLLKMGQCLLQPQSLCSVNLVGVCWIHTSETQKPLLSRPRGCALGGRRRREDAVLTDLSVERIENA